MASEDERVEIRASLEKKFRSIIDRVQNYYGLNSISVTLRLIIMRYYEEVFKPELQDKGIDADSLI